MTYQYLLDNYGPTMTFQQAAKVLGLHWQTVREMCLRNDIKTSRVGRRWILTSKAIAEYIDNSSQEAERKAEVISFPRTGKGYKKIV